MRARPPRREPWPSQLEGGPAFPLDLTDDLVVALPNSAGKTRVAEIADADDFCLQNGGC